MPARLGIVGDSQSEGLSRRLVPLLEQKGFRVVGTQLQRGMSLANMRRSSERRSHAKAVADRSDVLVVILGGNSRVTDEQTYRDHVRWFLDQVASHPREIWWVGPAASIHPDWSSSHATTRQLQRKILPGQGRVSWIDAWPMTESGIQYAPDQLHFTRQGYDEWASRLINQLPPSNLGLLIGAALFGAAVGAFLAMRR